MASFVLPRLLERRCMALAATSSLQLQHLHALSSLHNLHYPSFPSHHPNPTSHPSLPTNLLNQSIFPFSTPTFPNFSHLDPLFSLFGPGKDPFIGQSCPTLNPPVHQFKFQSEPNFALSFAPFSNVDLIPLSEPVGLGLEIERDEQIVIRADSVKKKRKRKMNKHKLKKLRKKLRRKT